MDTSITGTPRSASTKRKFVIESVERKAKSRAEPVLATFSNGKPRKSGNLKGILHQNNTANFRYQSQRLFTVETPWLNYIGKNYNDNDSSPNHDLVFLGVLNKATGKMRLIETSSYTLQPKISFEKDPTNPESEETYQEKVERITTLFGSKRAKKVMKQRQINQLNMEGMAGAIKEATADVTVEQDDLMISADNECDYLTLLPESDREAKSPEEVYKLEWIAPDYFLANFEDIARKHIADKMEFDEMYSLLTRVMLSVAKLEADEENQVRLVCLALYVEYLVKLCLLKNRDIWNRTVLEGCPHEVKQHILNQYTKGRGKGRTMSAEDKDRILCLILVLALIGLKFEVAANILVESLHIDIKRLHLLMRAIGASYVGENFSFKLRFPLTKIAKSYKRMAKSIR
ncbi:DNA-directed RNA polymerase I subunit RPA49 isoform X1 [Macrobrachium rosenbergii]|uniref:DNA-directed RNA polymerase I subunit RPA49 isoform X1 n=1 Tax=Macrobrachium rosenbergii TaxID=79674 RepID=UPI0034D3C510